MPVRWKIFRVANYLQLVISLAILGLAAYSYVSIDTTEAPWFLLFIISMVLVICNNCVNVHIVYRYYPDKQLPLGKKVVSIVLLIFFILINIILLLAIGLGIEDLRSAEDYEATRSGWVILGILIAHVAQGIYIICLQVGLPRALERNSRRHMQQLLDDIGKP